ncbi:MAG: hypothetical protein V2G41_10005 [bacterium JZ-2024 1]
MPISWTNQGYNLRTKVDSKPLSTTNSQTGPSTTTQSEAGPPSAVTILIGLVVLLLILKFVGEHESTAIKPAHISIGGYNLLAVGVTAVVFIALMKLIFMRYTVPGISPLMKFI